MSKWIKTVRNEGLLRYYMVGNLERIMLTNPEALSEVLVKKAYDFPKPDAIRESLERVTGRGVLLAEGDGHKVVSQCDWCALDGTDINRCNVEISCQPFRIAISRTSIPSSGQRAWIW